MAFVDQAGPDGMAGEGGAGEGGAADGDVALGCGDQPADLVRSQAAITSYRRRPYR
nr:hypothetical protein [Frankia tisae]